MAATVRENVRFFREEARLTQADLSARLSEVGRPIPVASVAKIESGDRRVDVDDLAALARALRIPTTALIADTSTRRVKSGLSAVAEAAERVQGALADYNRLRLDLAIAAEDLGAESEMSASASSEALDSGESADLTRWMRRGPMALAYAYESTANQEAAEDLTIDEAVAFLRPPTHSSMPDELAQFMNSTRFRG